MSAMWQHALAEWLAAHKAYPNEARRQGAQGIVGVSFTVDREGHVLQVELRRSAGSAVLDAAAVAMLRHATLPPPPLTTAQSTTTVTIQVHYTLTD
jgi:periplasmic protein TonB